MRCCFHIIVIIFAFGFTTSLTAQKSLSKVEKSFSKVKIKTGISDVSLTGESGNKWKAKVSFPPNVQNQNKNKLIIALHWAGDFGTYKEFSDCLAVPGFKNLNAIIISPEGEAQLWSTKKNEEKVLSIIKNAQKFWNVDSNKIAITGYSNGANGSWFFAENYPDLFSAAIPMAGLYRITEKIDIPVYAIHGKEDELFPVKKSGHWIKKTKDAGSDVTFVINDQLTHFQGCSYVDELIKAGEWLDKIWNKK